MAEDWATKSLNRWTSARLRFDTRITLFIERTMRRKTFTLAQRVRLATQFLRDKTVINLSRPVRKIKGVRSKRITVDPNSRSKRGEFPRADTTRLMKDIFFRMSDDGLTGYVGTTLMYGAKLELRMDRSFLRKTLNEMRQNLILILQGGTPHV